MRICGVERSSRQDKQHLRACAVMACLPAIMECREQSVPCRTLAHVHIDRGREGSLATRHNEACEGGLTESTHPRTILPGCCRQLAASQLLNMPLSREVRSDSTAAWNPGQLATRYRNPSKPVNHLSLTHRPATCSKLMLMLKSFKGCLPA